MLITNERTRACACCCSADAAVSPAGTGNPMGPIRYSGAPGCAPACWARAKELWPLAATAAREKLFLRGSERGEEKRRRRTDVLWCQQSAQNEGRQASVFLSSHLVAASWELAWETMSLRLLISRIVSSRTSMRSSDASAEKKRWFCRIVIGAGRQHGAMEAVPTLHTFLKRMSIMRGSAGDLERQLPSQKSQKEPRGPATEGPTFERI